MTDDTNHVLWCIHHAPLLLSGTIVALVILWLIIDLVRGQRWP